MVYFCRSLTSAEAAARLGSFFRHHRNINSLPFRLSQGDQAHMPNLPLQRAATFRSKTAGRDEVDAKPCHHGNDDRDESVE